MEVAYTTKLLLVFRSDMQILSTSQLQNNKAEQSYYIELEELP